MNNRDWGRGEDGPRERQPAAPWHDPAGPAPGDPDGAHLSARHRTPSRRRAAERGQQEPVDSYLPRWALESGVRGADRGGRHAAPGGEMQIEAARPDSGGAWQATETAGGWRRDGGTSWHEAPPGARESEHTDEWRLGRPEHDRGYAGQRRAEDDPVPGLAAPRPPSQRPGTTWWWGPGVVDAPEHVPQAERPAHRSRRAAEDRPAVDPWDRESRRSPPDTQPDWPDPARPAADPPPFRPPAVDAWDASGVHAWRPDGGMDRRGHTGAPRWGQTNDTGPWATTADAGSWDRTPDADAWDRIGGTGPSDRFADTRPWDQTGDTGPWDRTGDTGPWDQTGDTGPWDRTGDTGRWERQSDDGWDRIGAPKSGGGAQEWSWPGRGDPNEDFWSYLRAADDDPRWMDPPRSAPRPPGSARRPAPGRGAAMPAGTLTATVRGRATGAGSGASARRIGDDLLDPDPGGSWRPLLYTFGCYLVPAILIFIWLLTLDGQVPAGCVTDVSGGGCSSPRSRALGSLVAGLPRFGLALAGSLVVALLLARAGTWRAVSVALAAAVVGGGLSTVLISAVTGQPLG